MKVSERYLACIFVTLGIGLVCKIIISLELKGGWEVGVKIRESLSWGLGALKIAMSTFEKKKKRRTKAEDRGLKIPSNNK